MELKKVTGGMQFKGKIYTGKTSPFRYHEAFHAIFRMMLSEQDIVNGMKLAFERMKIVIEPSAGTGIAVVLSEHFWKRTSLPKGAKVGVIICGGNIDFKDFFQIANFQ